VLRRFQVGPQRWSRGHRGVDLAARAGAQVLSPTQGVVTYAGTLADRGVMVVQLPSGLRVTVEPVWPMVAAGTPVRGGDRIGIVEAGSTHCGSSTCLHWGVVSGGRYLDPLQFVAGPRSAVLLPVLPFDLA
jgi:murein DD-endopeptidase MepM/ murein hydrolase activator NlpD